MIRKEVDKVHLKILSQYKTMSGVLQEKSEIRSWSPSHYTVTLGPNCVQHIQASSWLFE
jgi:hypothetical protein